ncbi:MAG: response regulator [Candidatus Hodarchaeales archaeon]
MSTVKKRSILIVDDEFDTLELLELLLSKEEFTVYTATTVKDAVKILEKKKNNNGSLPNLVLLDIKMPGTSGYDFCEFIKNDPIYRSIPIAFISALTLPKDVERGYACGADDFIKKPWSSNDELLLRINRLIGPSAIS